MYKSLIICDHSITDSFGQFSQQKAFQVNRIYTLDVSSKIGSPCGGNGNFETNSCSFYLPSGDFSNIRFSSYIYIKVASASWRKLLLMNKTWLLSISFLWPDAKYNMYGNCVWHVYVMLSTYGTGFQMGIASRDINLHFIFFFMIYQFIAFRNDNKQENAKKTTSLWFVFGRILNPLVIKSN